MQLAPKRNATAIRSKNGPRRIHSWNVFLVYANQAPPLPFPLRFSIIRPFFYFRFFGDGILAGSEFGEVVFTEPSGGSNWHGVHKETERNIFYFRGLRTKYILRMHAWRHGVGTTDWKIVVASWRILARGYPAGQEELRIELRTTGNWWRYLKLANDHFVNLLILPPHSSRVTREATPEYLVRPQFPLLKTIRAGREKRNSWFYIVALH